MRQAPLQRSGARAPLYNLSYCARIQMNAGAPAAVADQFSDEFGELEIVPDQQGGIGVSHPGEQFEEPFVGAVRPQCRRARNPALITGLLGNDGGRFGRSPQWAGDNCVESDAKRRQKLADQLALPPPFSIEPARGVRLWMWSGGAGASVSHEIQVTATTPG